MDLFKNRYCTLSFNEMTGILDQLWTEDTQKMSIEEYQEIQKSTVSMFEQHQAKGIFVDLKKFRWGIAPPMQIWTNKNVIEPLVSAGIKKISYTVPEELVAELSVQQTLEENEDLNFPYQYFSEERLARIWLASD